MGQNFSLTVILSRSTVEVLSVFYIFKYVLDAEKNASRFAVKYVQRSIVNDAGLPRYWPSIINDYGTRNNVYCKFMSTMFKPTKSKPIFRFASDVQPSIESTRMLDRLQDFMMIFGNVHIVHVSAPF